MGQSFEDLVVWQKSMDYAESIYRLTESFPTQEMYGLRSQLRRAAVSVPSNIAEGKGRWSDKEFTVFLCHARGSLNETITQLTLGERLGFIPKSQVVDVLKSANEVGRLINGLIKAFNKD